MIFAVIFSDTNSSYMVWYLHWTFHWWCYEFHSREHL